MSALGAVEASAAPLGFVSEDELQASKGRSAKAAVMRRGFATTYRFLVLIILLFGFGRLNRAGEKCCNVL